MKAAYYYGPKNLQIEDRPTPHAGKGQMVVKIAYCGVCGTDVEAYNFPGVLAPNKIIGHENVAYVHEIGEGAEGFEVGDRVICTAMAHCAENCTPCQEGMTHLCIHGFARTVGIGFVDVAMQSTC